MPASPSKRDSDLSDLQSSLLDAREKARCGLYSVSKMFYDHTISSLEGKSGEQYEKAAKSLREEARQVAELDSIVSGFPQHPGASSSSQKQLFSDANSHSMSDAFPSKQQKQLKANQSDPFASFDSSHSISHEHEKESRPERGKIQKRLLKQYL